MTGPARRPPVHAWPCGTPKARGRAAGVRHSSADDRRLRPAALAILGYLVVKAWPVLSWSFLVENPKHYMTAGGIWAPLVGTFYVVILSLVMAAPIGVLAGIYLNEYARENWLTRIVNLAVVNLAGVPSIVHALFGVGCSC